MKSKTCIWLAFICVGWILGFFFKGAFIAISPFTFFCAIAKPYFGWKKTLLFFNGGIDISMLVNFFFWLALGEYIFYVIFGCNVALLNVYSILVKTRIFDRMVF